MRLFATLSLAALLLVGCGEDESDSVDEATVTDQPLEDAPATDEDVDQAAAVTELGDSPQAYPALYIESEPQLEEADGEVSITFGAADRSWVPFIVRNGTDRPISRLEVLGMVVDGDGDTITSGHSQSVHPNVVEPGGYAIGYVYAGPDTLPEGATVDDLSIDYTEGLGEFENIVELDVEEVTHTGDAFTGRISNPHDIEVTGPVGIAVACLDGEGTIDAVFSSYADRDDIDAGGTSTFAAGLG